MPTLPSDQGCAAANSTASAPCSPSCGRMYSSRPSEQPVPAVFTPMTA